MKVIFPRGIPGSGKSTWAIEYVKGKHDWIRVNRDSLRNMRGDYNRPKQEGLITIWEKCIIESSLQIGLNVIVDGMNLNPNYLKQLTDLVKLYTNDIEFKEFKTYQRLANFRNYLSYKYLGFLGTEEQYNDDQFENYMKLADSENGYGEAKSHAGSYRKMWDDDLIKCQKLIEMAKQSQINMIQLKTFMDNNVCREVQETYFFLKSKSQ